MGQQDYSPVHPDLTTNRTACLC